MKGAKRPKITIVGAGGYVFPIRLTIDILSFPELQNCLLYLHDINPRTLAKNRRLIAGIIERNRLPTKLEAGTARRRALEGADYVIIAFQVGGIPAYTCDVEIPRRHGLDQPVGDTLGPGGVFRGLRSIAALKAIADDMRAVAPGALLIQYANPMAMNCWATSLLGIKTVGLCHSVQGTSRFLAHQLGLRYDEITFKCAGINHQAWFTEFRHRGEDVMPRLRETVLERFKSPLSVRSSKRGRTGRYEQLADHKISDEVYYWELVRGEIMRTFGYFHTESSHHASEYVPWFRKDARTVNAYIRRRWDYYRISRNYRSAGSQRHLKQICEAPLRLSEEYGARIIHSCETGARNVIYGNVPNWGPLGSLPKDSGVHVITNLPRESCVEVACLVDRNGVQPTVYGDLPPQLAAVNRACVSVQELAVKAALTGNRDLVHQAVAMDPLTGGLLTLPRIRLMVDEMLNAERRWLPQFK